MYATWRPFESAVYGGWADHNLGRASQAMGSGDVCQPAVAGVGFLALAMGAFSGVGAMHARGVLGQPDPPYHWAEATIVSASVALTGRILDELGVAGRPASSAPQPRGAGRPGSAGSVGGGPEAQARAQEPTWSPAITFNPMAVFVARARPLRFDAPEVWWGKARRAGDGGMG